MATRSNRRTVLKTLGAGLGAGLVGAANAAEIQGAQAETPSFANGTLVPSGAKKLLELTSRLEKAPRRRAFKTVPMILTDPNQWDHEAIAELMAYQGGPKQGWDNVVLAGPWLNLMRNAVNTQTWSLRHPDFLVVSVTHGPAHLALFDDTIWEKYQIPKHTGGHFATNTLSKMPPGGNKTPTNFEDESGVFSPAYNSIPVLQKRGVVFLGCHNAIWELSALLMKSGSNPDKLSHGAVAAELTNHLIPGVVLTPGVVATFLDLQVAGFHYA